MNKIITINLGGIAIQIEEDAYDMLRDYLKRLEGHFQGTESANEIMSDIENRIAEMLFEKLKEGKASINRTDIDEVAKTMGAPDDLGQEDTGETAREQYTYHAPKTKRLFRDPDDGRIGGVCSGLAKYFNIDVSLIRIIWIIMLFVFGSGFLIYVLLWAILPEARTTAEKLEMMGEVPNVENIKNSIRDGANSAYERIKRTAEGANSRRFLDRVVDIFTKLIKGVFGIFSVVLIVAICIALLIFFLKTFTHANWFNWERTFHFSMNDLNASLVGTIPYWVVKISFFLLIVIPLVYILVRLVTAMLGVPKPIKIVRQGVFSVWLLTLITYVIGIFYGLSEFKDQSSEVKRHILDYQGDTIIISANRAAWEGKWFQTDQNTELDVTQSPSNEFLLEISKECRGKDKSEIQKGIETIYNSYRLDQKTLFLSDRILLSQEGKTKFPKQKFVLSVPVGTYVILNQNTKHIISNIQNKQDVWDPDMAGKTFLMTNSGLSCMDCDNNDKKTSHSLNQGQTIREIDISDAIRVDIIEDGINRIDYPSDKKWKESLNVNWNNDRLEIERNNDLDVVLDWLSSAEDMKLVIHTSGVDFLQIDGSSQVNYRANSTLNKNYFRLETSGANKIDISELHSNKVSVTASGINEVNIKGKASIFILDLSGKTTVKAEDFVSETVSVDVQGFANCNVHATAELTGEVAGSSVVNYKGNPTVSVRTNGASKVKMIN